MSPYDVLTDSGGGGGEEVEEEKEEKKWRRKEMKRRKERKERKEGCVKERGRRGGEERPHTHTSSTREHHCST